VALIYAVIAGMQGFLCEKVRIYSFQSQQSILKYFFIKPRTENSDSIKSGLTFSNLNNLRCLRGNISAADTVLLSVNSTAPYIWCPSFFRLKGEKSDRNQAKKHEKKACYTE
jgi:hypothetical protein